jgi:mRNA-degrading endonuclease toxin of MazEF toxin-antitoxin module
LVLSPGDIYWVHLPDDGSRQGAEIMGERPFVVVSRYGVNRILKTVVAIPLTTSRVDDQRQPPYRIRIPKEYIVKDPGYKAEVPNMIAKVDQIMTLHVESRIRNRLGALNSVGLAGLQGGMVNLFDYR